jgi:tRNA threonylcarbamoyladenosine biosynthesis protein TsaB
MTWILHLETSTKACSVALSCNGKQIALKEQCTEQFSHAENITLFVDAVLNHAEISLRELAAVSVTSGPGSYTGLRIGVSTAKGFCYALGIPLLSVDSLFSLAQLAKEKYPNKTLCPVIDARRMEVYNAIYDASLTCIKEISADVILEDSYNKYEPFICFGDGQAKLHELWKERAVLFDSKIHASATGQINESYRKYCAGEFENLAYFEPFYLKDFVTKKC